MVRAWRPALQLKLRRARFFGVDRKKAGGRLGHYDEVAAPLGGEVIAGHGRVTVGLGLTLAAWLGVR